MRRLSLHVLAAVLLSVGASTAAQTFTARVVGVADGDTISVLHNGQALRIRLEGIDAPEDGQDFSNRAKQLTSALVFGERVDVWGKELDWYGRLVARVHVGEEDVSEALVRSGLAWHYVEYSDDPVLAAAEQEARAAGRGLWRVTNPQPPWEYRDHAIAARLPAPLLTTSEQAQTRPYHGNVSSKIFHRSSCQHYNCKNCTAIFETREAAIAAGYRPCRVCRP